MPWSREGEACASGCTLAPTEASGVGRRGSALVLLEEGGGGLVGYFRAAVLAVAGSLEAVFAALEVDDPISNNFEAD